MTQLYCPKFRTIMARKSRIWILGIILFILPVEMYSYEKTLRKIVRNQSKMVQRPFSDDESRNVVLLSNASINSRVPETKMLMPQGYTQVKTLYHNLQRPKISTILSSVENGRTKSTYSRMHIARNENASPIEMRLTRDTFVDLTKAPQKPPKESVLFEANEIGNKTESYLSPSQTAVDTYSNHDVPTRSKFFPDLSDQELQPDDQKLNDKEIPPTISSNHEIENANNSLLVESIFLMDESTTNKKHTSPVNDAIYHQKPNILFDETLTNSIINAKYTYNVTNHHNSNTCKVIQGVNTDIDATMQFSNFDIEPAWMNNKHYWDNIFDSRYESLMQNPVWPPLHVILMPCSHVDSIWKRSFEHSHNNTVTKIISNIVKKLQYYKNMTFTWNEVSHLSQWWKRISQKSRMVNIADIKNEAKITAFSKLLKSGRLEITTGGWVESDEATAHLFGLVHQLIEGHQWLKKHLHYVPKVGWLTNSVTHSPTLPYLLSAAGITKLVITNVHYTWEQFFAEFQFSDFIWVQNFDSDKKSETPLNQELNRIGNERYPKHSVLTHYLQFNSNHFGACGPNTTICSEDFDFKKSNKNVDIHIHNIKNKAELLLEQYSKTGTLSPHNVMIAPLGGPERYEYQTEFDFQYNNYQKLTDFINFNKEIYSASFQFGTPKDYFNIILSKHKNYPSLSGDFLNFADTKSATPAYWSGFFTSRPKLKILLRELQSTMRATEILFSFAVNFKVIPRHNMTGLLETLNKARENFSRLQDRHVVGGTISYNVLKYVSEQILMTTKRCWHLQEVAASLLTSKQENKSLYLQKLVYRERELTTDIRMVNIGDQIYIFNSLSQERTEIIELITKHPNIRVIDHNKNDLTIQINPVWYYTSENLIKISTTAFKVSFAIVIPPMTLELYKIKETYDATHNAATVYCSYCIIDKNEKSYSVFPFNIQSIQPGDIQLESYKHRVTIDEHSGFLKTVIEKGTNTKKNVLIDYGAFRSADVNAGVFLFNTNITNPLEDILLPFRDGTKTKVVIIISGQVSTEMTSIFGRLLQHSIKLSNLVNSPIANAISIESKVDFELSPNNRELEVFLSIKTDINNGNSPEIYIDNNGFQYTPRKLNISKRIESNMYPMTSMAYIQDGKSRLTVITDHAQGITALQEGQLVIMLDRRVLYNDGRGTHEGLADSCGTYHRHYMLLENLIVDQSDKLHQSELKLPSFSSMYLANALSYSMELFIADKEASEQAYFTFLPLIKTSFPCDMAVINFRTILNKAIKKFKSRTALLVLVRQGMSCNIDDSSIQRRCEGNSNLSLDKILRNIQSVSHTNLVGTEEGVPVGNINLDNFSAVGLLTLKIRFY